MVLGGSEGISLMGNSRLKNVASRPLSTSLYKGAQLMIESPTKLSWDLKLT